MSVSAAPRIGYRSTERSGFSDIRAIVAIARSNIRVIFRYWFFWVLIVLSMLHFLITFALIYLKSQMAVSEEMGFAAVMFDQIEITGTGRAYHGFLLRQTENVYIMLAYASAVLLATDFQAGGINFYLSKPIGRIHYLLGKLGALFVLVGIQTFIPAMGLFAEAALYAADFKFVQEHTNILIGIAAYSFFLMAVPSILGLAIAVVFRKTAAIIVVWIGLLFVLPAFGGLMRLVFGSPYWLLLGLRHDLWLLGAYLFGIITRNQEQRFPYALIIVIALCTISIAVILRRLRPVEVVQ